MHSDRLHRAARAVIEVLEQRRLLSGDVPLIWVNSPVSADEEGQQPGSFLFHRYDSCVGDPGNSEAVVQFKIDLNVNQAATPGYDLSSPGTDYRVDGADWFDPSTGYGAITLSPGQSYKSLTIVPADDGEAEPDENVSLSIQDYFGYTVDSNSRGASASILDNDTAYITLGDELLTVGKVDSLPVSVTDRHGNPKGEELSVEQFDSGIVQPQVSSFSTDPTTGQGWLPIKGIAAGVSQSATTIRDAAGNFVNLMNRVLNQVMVIEDVVPPPQHNLVFEGEIHNVTLGLIDAQRRPMVGFTLRADSDNPVVSSSSGITDLNGVAVLPLTISKPLPNGSTATVTLSSDTDPTTRNDSLFDIDPVRIVLQQHASIQSGTRGDVSLSVVDAITGAAADKVDVFIQPADEQKLDVFVGPNGWITTGQNGTATFGIMGHGEYTTSVTAFVLGDQDNKAVMSVDVLGPV
jgi:hypothetical protein